MLKLNDLIKKFEFLILNKLNKSMENYASEEILEIETALKSESFFNLTNVNVNEGLIENLKLGKKNTPKTNYSILSEILKFNKEIVSVIKAYVKSEFKISVEINPENIIEKID